MNYKKVISETELYSKIKEENRNLPESSLKWELFHYIKANSLVRVGVKKYVTNARLYEYDYTSKAAKDINEYLRKQYPDIKIVLWETSQLNEWLNLLINNNFVYVEVDKEYADYIFSSLNNIFGDKYLILLNPNKEMISRYSRNNLVIVKTLYSKSPLNSTNRQIKLEKLLVDIVADDYFLDSRGIRDVVQGIKDSYDIDIDKTLAYATRRRVKNYLMDSWEHCND